MAPMQLYIKRCTILFNGVKGVNFRYIYPSLLLVQHMKTRPCLTELLWMVPKESNQTNNFRHVFVGFWN